MAKTFKVLSALLNYPTQDLQKAAPALAETLAAEGLLPGKTLQSVNKLIAALENGDLFDIQERYVLLFDRTRSLSLYLFEHIHGESRERGQAMVDLAEHYARAGLEIDAKELPDYLPLFLEFLSTQPAEEARELLGQVTPILAVLKARLRKRESPYAHILSAVETLAAPSQKTAPLPDATDDEDPNDLRALDRAWEDAAVTFGAGSALDGGCSADRVASRIRAGLRPTPENQLPQA
jgi:nitrate reductase delta subunit